MELRTERLLLREWRDDDLEPFAALNADPEVMRHFAAPLDRAQSDAMAERIQQRFAENGWGLWAVEVIGGAPFIGFVGLAVPTWEADFRPGVEVGWRLAREHWGHGYATEGARAARDFAFTTLELDEILSFTIPDNERSQRVMRQLGLSYAQDFGHPNYPPGHRIHRSVLYRLTRDEWAARRQG